MYQLAQLMQVMPLLSHPNEKIVHEVLAFLEAILDFGNTDVQEGLKELVKSREHQLFSTLKAILKKSSTAFHERYKQYCGFLTLSFAIDQ